MESSRSAFKVLGLWAVLAAIGFLTVSYYPGGQASEEKKIRHQLRGVHYQRTLLKAYYLVSEHRRLSELGPALAEAQARDLSALRPALESSLDEISFLIRKSLPYDSSGLSEKDEKDAQVNIDGIIQEWKSLKRDRQELTLKDMTEGYRTIAAGLRTEIKRTMRIFHLDRSSDPGSWPSMEMLTDTFPDASERLTELSTLVQTISRQNSADEAQKMEVLNQAAAIESLKVAKLPEVEKSFRSLAQEARKLGSGDIAFDLEYFQKKVETTQRNLKALHQRNLENFSLILKNRFSRGESNRP